MPKQKTHKGIKKVLNIRPSGTISRDQVGMNHNTGGKPSKFKRNKRKSVLLSAGDKKRLKNII
jgi:ribosomal protein L35